MLLMVKVSFPRSSLKQAAKAYTEMPKLPATVSRRGPFFHLDDKGSIHGLSIFTFKDTAITHNERQFIEKRLRVFSDVPEFTYTIEDWLDMQEALIRLSKE
jgi:hypothetical protein